MTGRRFDTITIVFALVLCGLAVLVPFLNMALPTSSPFQVPTYLVALWGKYACYAILALAIDLIWGYCGILSLGHGAFFALGGYAMGMYLMRQIGTRGVYADPVRPDFMVFLNWPELPVYWYGFNHFAYALLMVVLVPGALAFVFGWFAFRSRVTGVYLSIITQALTFALMLGFFRNNFGFGGNNGLTDFKDILGFNVQAAGTRGALFAISCVVLALMLLMCRAIVTSKFGKVLIAIRDAESRTRFLGYKVESYKLLVFTLSACMAGVAGALYVPQVGIINPSEFAPANSIEEVVWVAVGGRGTLAGAILGAVVVNFGKTYFTSGSLLPYWMLAIAAFLVLVGVVAVRRNALIGAIGGFVVMGIGLLGDYVLAQSGAGFSLMPYWGYAVGGILIVTAMGSSWHGYPLGAIFGALLIYFIVTPFETVALAPYWLFALGGLFVGVTLLLPRGIIGTLAHWLEGRRKPDKPDAAGAQPVGEPIAAE